MLQVSTTGVQQADQFHRGQTDGGVHPCPDSVSLVPSEVTQLWQLGDPCLTGVVSRRSSGNPCSRGCVQLDNTDNLTIWGLVSTGPKLGRQP